MQKSDLIIIGGGIVGLATAYRFLERFPGKTVTVLEKEAAVAKHQTGRNSGVLHSGVYYRPGSLRALNCRLGKEAMEEFCRREGLPYDRCGKVIVATEERLLPMIEKTLANGTANGVRCERIGPERLREIEPHSAGIAAIHVPDAGVTDYAMVARRLAEIITSQGSRVVTNARAMAIRRDTAQAVVETAAGEFAAEQVVNCAGLYSDRVARLSGVKPSALILPFRGEFYTLKPKAHHLVRGLIYPIGDPNFPFLGVHFTKIVHGGYECGPNAVLAFAREGYRNTTVNLRDIAEWATYIGSWRMAIKHWRMGLEEMWRSFSRPAFVRALQRLIPEIKDDELEWAPAGVRAQAVSRQGDIIDDWIIEETDRVINVENAPSPAATAALNVGRLVVDRLAPRFA
ncbi:MAG TPA: L-2-hydroxyglutarate oxidase [Lacipirellulaceae bacterium]|jgi:L-2-hydroxyglutarate oxidase